MPDLLCQRPVCDDPAVEPKLDALVAKPHALTGKGMRPPHESGCSSLPIATNAPRTVVMHTGALIPVSAVDVLVG